MWIKSLKIIACFACLVLLDSCTYRFTNKHIYVPDGAKTITIAPIYNSSRIVLPHDIVWSAFQQAFGSDGHLVVSKSSRADYFLQMHIKDGRTAQYETDSKGTPKNPDMFLDANNKPLAPNAYVDLHSADIFSKRELISFLVKVEIWDLREKSLLLKKDYPISSNFNMFAIPSTPESQFIRDEENLELVLISLSKNLASSVVNDLFASPTFEIPESLTPPVDVY